MTQRLNTDLAGGPTFQDHADFPREEKQALYQPWRQFIRHGFRQADFTPELSDFLILHGDMYPYWLPAEVMWEKYFAHLTYDLRHFLAHFEAQPDGHSADPTRLGMAADLAASMWLTLNSALPAIRLVIHWYEVQFSQGHADEECDGIPVTAILYDRLAALFAPVSVTLLRQPALFAMTPNPNARQPVYASPAIQLVRRPRQSPAPQWVERSFVMAGQLTDHPQFPLQTKQEILADWEAFILSGFDLAGASDVLISYLWWYAELGYQAEMPKAVEQIWWALFNDTTGMLWQVIVQFGTRAEPTTGRQTWLADSKVGDLNQAMCDCFAPYYEPFLAVLTEFETEGERDLKAEALDQAMQQLAAADPTLTTAERRTLALADDDAGVVSQNGGIYLTADLHTRLRAAAKMIPGVFQLIPRRPLRQPALFAMRTRPSTEVTGGPTGQPISPQPVAPARFNRSPARRKAGFSPQPIERQDRS